MITTYTPNPAIESHLNNVFEDGAKQLENSMKGTTHQYKIRGMGYTAGNGENVSGICEILSIRYDRGLDCNVMTFRDINTGETRSICQFEVFLMDE